MATDIAAVLLVPAAGDPLGLLREGPCGARPPMVARWDHEDTWTHGYHGRSYSPRDAVPSVRFALALAWDGAPVAEGLDRLARVWPRPDYPIPFARPCPEWVQYPADGLARTAKWLPKRAQKLGLGTVVLLDDAGKEVQRAE